MIEETQSIVQPENTPEAEAAKETPKIILTSDLIQGELQKEKDKSSQIKVLRSTIGILIAVVAAVVLIVVLVLPVLRISGNSMEGTLHDGDIVVALNSSKFKPGDVIAFYHGKDVLLKRVIASPGQWVDMDAEGNVYVDDELLDEPYVTEKALGQCNISFPCQVPEGELFVLGDHRTVSIDSRNRSIGCVDSETAIGRVILRVWPLSDLGSVD